MQAMTFSPCDSSASASSEPTPTTPTPRASASPWATPAAMRRPVNEPGPSPYATPSICDSSRRASPSSSSTIPRTRSAWRCSAGSLLENSASPRLAATEQASVEVSIASRFMERILADCITIIRPLVQTRPSGGNMSRSLVCLALGLSAAAALAQDAYPTHPVTMVVAFPPGGVAELTGRPTAIAMEKALKQRVIIENRPGAAGAVGNARVATSKPDGYTLLMALSSISVIPEAERLQGHKPPYELAQFIPIALVSADPVVLVVRDEAPWK